MRKCNCQDHHFAKGFILLMVSDFNDNSSFWNSGKFLKFEFMLQLLSVKKNKLKVDKLH